MTICVGFTNKPHLARADKVGAEPVVLFGVERNFSMLPGLYVGLAAPVRPPSWVRRWLAPAVPLIPPATPAAAAAMVADLPRSRHFAAAAVVCVVSFAKASKCPCVAITNLQSQPTPPAPACRLVRRRLRVEKSYTLYEVDHFFGFARLRWLVHPLRACKVGKRQQQASRTHTHTHTRLC